MQFIDEKPRCDWIKDHPLYLKYHDEEWGIPVYDDHKLFELLVLESAEAGLSWLTILKKRENYRLAYDNFDPKEVACYDSKKEKELLMNAGIIRSKAKITSSVQNARKFLKIQKQNHYNPFTDF
jgi:DNA-3-methyladenine glycosylase I